MVDQALDTDVQASVFDQVDLRKAEFVGSWHLDSQASAVDHGELGRAVVPCVALLQASVDGPADRGRVAVPYVGPDDPFPASSQWQAVVHHRSHNSNMVAVGSQAGAAAAFLSAQLWRMPHFHHETSTRTAV